MMGVASRIAGQFGISAAAVLPGSHAPVVRQTGIGSGAAQGFMSCAQVQTLFVTLTQLLAGIGQIQMGNDPGGNGGVGPFARAKQQRFHIRTSLLIVRDGIGVIVGLKGLVALCDQIAPGGQFVALGSASIMKLMIMICIYIIKVIPKANRKQIKRQAKKEGEHFLKPISVRLCGQGERA